MSYNLTGAAFGGNVALGKAGLTGLSGAASTFTTSAGGGATALLYTNRGAVFALANQAGAATPTNDAASATAVAGTAASGAAFRPLVAQQAPPGLTAVYAGSACCFVFGADANGNVRVAQGPVVNYADTSAKSTPVPFPGLPDWFTPFSYVVVTLASAVPASWMFGSGLWNAAGITINPPVDVMDLPPVPPLTA